MLTICAYRLVEEVGFKIQIKDADPEIHHSDLVTSVTALNRHRGALCIDSPRTISMGLQAF